MSDVRVTRVQHDSDYRATWTITVGRHAGYQSITPVASDLPPDVRQELTEWLRKGGTQ